LPKNTWVLLTFVFDKSTKTPIVYINGEKDIAWPNRSNMDGIKQCLDHNLYLGIAAGNTGKFNGLLQDVAIWNRALSSDEVKELYTNSLAK